LHRQENDTALKLTLDASFIIMYPHVKTSTSKRNKFVLLC
jgi:hypothetical protein